MQAVETHKEDTGQGGPLSGGLWDRYGHGVMLGGLAAYLLLLFIGVIAEVFDLQSVLDWWIWRPPGKGPG